MTKAIVKSQLEQLAEQIKSEHQQCEADMRASLAHAIKAGELLIDAKALCQHGEWGAWLQDHCEFSERTAQGYMRIAREWPGLEASNPQRVADLSMRGALMLLSEPHVQVDDPDLTWSEYRAAAALEYERTESKARHEKIKAMINAARTPQEAIEAERIAESWVEYCHEQWLQSRHEFLDKLDALNEMGMLPDTYPFDRLKTDPRGRLFKKREWDAVGEWIVGQVYQLMQA